MAVTLRTVRARVTPRRLGSPDVFLIGASIFIVCAAAMCDFGNMVVNFRSLLEVALSFAITAEMFPRVIVALGILSPVIQTTVAVATYMSACHSMDAFRLRIRSETSLILQVATHGRGRTTPWRRERSTAFPRGTIVFRIAI